MSIVFSRVANGHLSDSGPQQDLKKCDGNQLGKLSKEMESIKNRYKTLIAKRLFEHFPVFAMFKPDVPQATDCRHAKEMSS
jgi:hypothetical protein